MPRFYCPTPLATGLALSLPAGAARHVQVLRLQPGDLITLFNGEGGEFDATVTRMGRSDVQVRVGTHSALEREALRAVQLVVGMPANERMDWLVEKATELGVARITPLMTQRTVLKLQGERALKRQLHWLGIAQSACAQSGRNRVPQIDLAQSWSAWWSQHKPASDVQQFVLSLQPQARPWRDVSRTPPAAVCVLSGPEGGLSEEEESLAIANGFAPVSLGAHTLRSETAPLVVLSQLL